MRLEDILLSGENMQPATRKVVHRSPAHTVRLLNLPHLQDEAIEADSSVERDFVHCAALFTLTRAIKAQPFKLSLKASSYTPDFAVKFADGSDRKSTRLNSSHLVISYAVFCLQKKKIR